jgi:hypothetical protein
MIRLNIVVEGQTEEAFVRDVLTPYLSSTEINVYPSARCVETSRSKSKIFRGGLVNYKKAKRDLELWMKEDQKPETYFTAMFDLYRLPETFPGYKEAKRTSDPLERAKILEEYFKKDISHPADRFIPYIQVHEFEALIFADPSMLIKRFPGQEDGIHNLAEIKASFQSPEHIDDGEKTAPSKRILKEITGYDKVADGPITTSQIGLDKLREECAHFNSWISILESLEQLPLFNSRG